MSSTHTNASGGNFRASFYIRPDQDKVCQKHAGPSLPETDSSCCPLTNLDRVPVESPSGIPATALAEIQAAAESSGPANPHRPAGATVSCRPMPSLRARRRWFTLLCTATTIGLLSASLLVPGGNQFLAPGPLCSQHARLMNSDGVGDCSACHAAGDTSAIAWLGSVFVGNRSLGPTQTELCLKCHDEQLRFGQQLAATPTAPGTPTQPGSQPTYGLSDAVHHSGWPQHPHNLAPEFLQQRTDDRADPTRLNLLASWQAAGSGNPDERLACSRCHQEHQGTDHDLAALTDSQCQSCHSQVYGAFEQPASRGGHPEFVSYPQKRRSRIAFDHVTHASQHFPQQQLEFACQQCHLDDARQDAKLLAPFEQACVSCHQQPLETSLTKGIELIALPMLDTNALQSAGVDIGQWPAGCDGDFDGRIPELGKLLLLADPQAAQALETLGGTRFEFIDVDPRQPAQLVAVGELVWAMKQLLADLAEDSQHTVRTRLARLSQSNEVSLPIRELASQFDDTSVRRAVAAWLPDLQQELANQPPSSSPQPAQPAGNSSGSVAPTTVQFRLATQSTPLPQTTRQPIQDDPDLLAPNPLSPLAEQLKTDSSGPAALSPTADRPSTEEPAAPEPAAPDRPPSTQETQPVDPDNILIENPLSSLQAPRVVDGVQPPATPPGVPPTAIAPVTPQSTLPAAAGIGGAATPSSRQPISPAELLQMADRLNSQRTEKGWWVEDPANFSIRYQPSGHADAMLARTLDFLADEADNPATADLLDQHRSLIAPGQCSSCHSIEQTAPASPRWIVNWKARKRDARVADFNWFSHRPHLQQPETSACSSCHRLDESRIVKNDFASVDPWQDLQGDGHGSFAPLTKADCASCHRRQAASTRCATCHDYHVGGRRY